MVVEMTWAQGAVVLRTIARVLQVLIQIHSDAEERGKEAEISLQREEAAPAHEVCPKEAHLPMGCLHEGVKRDSEEFPKEQKVVVSKSRCRTCFV